VDNVTSSLDGVVGDMKENCIFAIKTSLNITSDEVDEFEVDEFVRWSCPGEPTTCGGHGTCNKGRCSCDTGICICTVVLIIVCT